MKKATLQLETLTCPSCMQKIEAALKSLTGVDKESVSVSFNTSKAKLKFDDDALNIGDIETAITRVGYEVKKSTVK